MRRSMDRTLLWSVGAVVLFGAAACVGTREPPLIPKQSEIAYGPKVFLVDDTVGMQIKDGLCTRLGEAKVGTTTTATTAVAATDDVHDASGAILPINPRIAHNCFIDVKPKTLHVDAVEVTNELFQLCVDSGWCSTPDPSKASKGQVCKTEGDFDRCPVVEVTEGQAVRFCEWVGRRLPSGVEHVIMRQAEASDTQDPATIPVYPTGSKMEADRPATCQAAVIGPAGCSQPLPITLGSKPEDTKGAAAGDVVSGSSGQVYDLMGNVAEWSSDLIPAIRGAATGYPWFCQGPVPPVLNAGDAPACPEGATCVNGQYQPPGRALGIYPVCVAFQRYRAQSGAFGALFGGSFGDTKATRQQIGVFGRREEKEPNDKAVKEFGFRCAGDPAVDDEVEAP